MTAIDVKQITDEMLNQIRDYNQIQIGGKVFFRNGLDASAGVSGILRLAKRHGPEVILGELRQLLFELNNPPGVNEENDD